MEQLTNQFIQELLRKQKQYFSENHTLSAEFRRSALLKLRHAILSGQTELERALSEDLGKHPQECYTSEIGFVLTEITHTLKHLKTWMKPIRKKSPMYVFSSKSRIEKQPYGSVLIMGPFNYPFQLLIAPLVAAIAAGNCAVLSPSELTPHTAAVIKKLISDCFPSEFVFCTDGGIENNDKLLHSRFDKIFLTGSIQVGKIVMRAAAFSAIEQRRRNPDAAVSHSVIFSTISPPHSEQNFSPSLAACPHFAHTRRRSTIFPPQSGQNFSVGAAFLPHFSQTRESSLAFCSASFAFSCSSLRSSRFSRARSTASSTASSAFSLAASAAFSTASSFAFPSQDANPSFSLSNNPIVHHSFPDFVLILYTKFRRTSTE